MARHKEFDETETLGRAMRLFWAQGYYATSMQELVDCMGINRASLYDTYGDKKNLYEASLTMFIGEKTKIVIEQIEKSVSVHEMATELLAGTLATCKKDKALGCFAVNTAIELTQHDQKIKKTLDQNFTQIHAAITQRIALELGAIESQPSTKAAELSWYLINCVNGLRVAQRAGMPHEVLASITQTSLNGFLQLYKPS